LEGNVYKSKFTILHNLNLLQFSEYKVIAIPTLMYASECRALTKQQDSTSDTPELRIIGALAGYRRTALVRNYRIREEPIYLTS
jgi:hypothetical protein